MEVRSVHVGEQKIGGDERRLTLIAGPCVIESEEHALMMAKRIKQCALKLGLQFVFKASFDKANRTSIHSFRGPGLKEGLKILERIKVQAGVLVTSDIHEPAQAALAGEVLDIIQIPAFLSRQTDLLTAAAKTAAAINVKKGQFLAPWDVRPIIEKLEAAGASNILLTERGASFGYNRLVSDFRAIPIMRGFGYPVIFDATHSVQMPGGLGASSGGEREFVPYLAKAAAAVGIDALFLEVHDAPERAKSDGANMLPLDKLESMLKPIVAIDEIVKTASR